MVASIKRNRYDIFLILLIVSVIYGRWGLLHPTTILSLMYFPSLLKNINLLKLNNARPFVVSFLFWFVYACMSFAWTPRTYDTFLDLFLLFVHFALFLEIVVFALKANHPVQTIVIAWVLAFSLTSIVALWEIFTNHHLTSARIEREYYAHSPNEVFKKVYATVTFFNPNTYCTFICMSIPFLLYWLSQSNNRNALLRSMGLVFIAIFIMSRNSSRGGLLAMGIMLVVYLIFRLRNSEGKSRQRIYVGMLIISLLLVYYGRVFFASILFRVEDNGMLESQSRMVLIYSSWLIFLQSHGLGMGVGSMMYVLGHSDTNPTVYLYAHNLFMEILIEYGIIILFVFVCFLFHLYLNSRKKDKKVKAILIGALLALPFYSVINSENLRPHFIWTYYASLYVISRFDMQYNKNENTICNPGLSIGKESHVG